MPGSGCLCAREDRPDYGSSVSASFYLTHFIEGSEIEVRVNVKAVRPEDAMEEIKYRLCSVASWIENAYDVQSGWDDEE